MRIGVIGAGISGLTATWLLNEEHEVHLFEKKDSLGGHAHSITVPWAGHALTVDPGAQNFSTQMYPCFLELLRILGVQTQFTPMRIVLSWLTEPKELLLTPTGNFWELRHSICPGALSAQLWLAAAIWRAAAIKSWDVTVQDFIGQLNAPPPFVTDILTPFLSMMLGTPKSETHRASLRAAMVYPVLHRPANPLKPFNMLSVPSGVKTILMMTWGLYFLSSLPHVQEKLHREAAANGGAVIPDIAAATMRECWPYLYNVLRESLRLGPPAALFNRPVIKDVKLDGFELKRGTLLWGSPYITHRSPYIWKDAERFIPERWDQPVPTGAFLPFSLGPRTCVGSNYAYLEAGIGFATLMKYFTVECLTKALGYEVGLTFRPDRPVKILLRAR